MLITFDWLAAQKQFATLYKSITYTRFMAQLVVILLSFFTWHVSAQAHESSTAYLSLDETASNASERSATFEIAVRDLALLLPVDANQDSAVTWGEISAQTQAIQQLITLQIKLSAETDCQPVTFEPLMLSQRAGFSYIYQRYTLGCAGPIDQIDYQVMQGVDSNHRLIFTNARSKSTNASTTPIRVLSTGISSVAPQTWISQVKNFAGSGVRHLLIGWDHLLFLFVLLIPAVYTRSSSGALQPVTHARPALIELLWVATAFTLAHSITLTLAALQIISIPSRLIEALIALSIALAALNNLMPVFRIRAVFLAFGFGLIHGFGFANVLSDLPIGFGERVLALLSFNIGIELAQILVIVLLFPLALLLRRTSFYRYGVFIGGSVISILIALWWVYERVWM